jgi:putative heme-binding domain-containing protein
VLKPAPAESRAKVIERFAPVKQMKGDGARGAAVFNKLCSSCHALNGEGHAVGPDLRAITDKSPDALLRSILDPSAVIDGKYTSYIVQTVKGQTINGIISDENATSLTVLQPNDVKSTILRKELKAVRSSNVSLMPEGLETGLSPQDMADLVRYVQEGK